MSAWAGLHLHGRNGVRGPLREFHASGQRPYEPLSEQSPLPVWLCLDSWCFLVATASRPTPRARELSHVIDPL